MTEKRVSDSETIMTELIMPNDTNPLHNLMGGNLLRWMDIAGGICAGKHAGSHVTTASVDNVSFKRPIPLGDVITIKAVVTRAFNTSMEIYVEVYTSDIKGGNHRMSNDAYYTFVALDDETFRPCKVPKLVPVTAEEQRRYETAQRRRELRLLMSGRLKPKDAHDIRALFEAEK
ncbi:MAG: acyl-CoA thioesterase [Bacteroidota bacterium]